MLKEPAGALAADAALQPLCGATGTDFCRGRVYHRHEFQVHTGQPFG